MTLARQTWKLPQRKPARAKKQVKRAFDRDALQRICEMHEREFADAFGMTEVRVPQRAPDDFYLFRDHGSRVLAVAHLDTVSPHSGRACRFVETEAGPVVFSRALDDRLGAYVILDMLPALGIQHDVLLTVGEESGRSTAEYFEAEKEYDWVIEFDRGGTDVVMYQYDDEATAELVFAAGADVGVGSFSDICYLEHLGVKAFNWGVGYTGDYHGPRAHAFLFDTFVMVSRYLDFLTMNAGIPLPHQGARDDERYWWDDNDDPTVIGDEHAHGQDEYATLDRAWTEDDYVRRSRAWL